MQLDPQITVLVGDDRIYCEDDKHDSFQVASLLMILFVAFGVPALSAFVLYNKQRRMEAITPTKRLAVAVRFRLDKSATRRCSLVLSYMSLECSQNEFAISPEDSQYFVADIQLGSSFGFLVNAFKPRYYAWESSEFCSRA